MLYRFWPEPSMITLFSVATWVSSSARAASRRQPKRLASALLYINSSAPVDAKRQRSITSLRQKRFDSPAASDLCASPSVKVGRIERDRVGNLDKISCIEATRMSRIRRSEMARRTRRSQTSASKSTPDHRTLCTPTSWADGRAAKPDLSDGHRLYCDAGELSGLADGCCFGGCRSPWAPTSPSFYIGRRPLPKLDRWTPKQAYFLSTL